MTDSEPIPFFRGVYAIRNRQTGAMYVGCTKQLNYRLNGHLYALRADRHDQPLLQAAWNSDGPDAFEMVMLESVSAEDHYFGLRAALRAAERRWLLELMAKGAALYNKTLPKPHIPVVDEREPEGAEP